MSEALKLNGKIVGRTAGGRILVELTPQEYLESLATWGPLVDVGSATPAEEPARVEKQIRKPNHFNPHPGRRNPAPKEQAAKTEKIGKPCKICGKTFVPRRVVDTVCGPDCAKVNRQRLSDEWRKAKQAERAKIAAKSDPTPYKKAVAGLAKEIITEPAKMTPEQKAARLDRLRAGLRNVDRRRSGESRTITASDVPAELAQANLEAGKE